MSLSCLVLSAARLRSTWAACQARLAVLKPGMLRQAAEADVREAVTRQAQAQLDVSEHRGQLDTDATLEVGFYRSCCSVTCAWSTGQCTWVWAVRSHMQGSAHSAPGTRRALAAACYHRRRSAPSVVPAGRVCPAAGRPRCGGRSAGGAGGSCGQRARSCRGSFLGGHAPGRLLHRAPAGAPDTCKRTTRRWPAEYADVWGPRGSPVSEQTCSVQPAGAPRPPSRSPMQGCWVKTQFSTEQESARRPQPCLSAQALYRQRAELRDSPMLCVLQSQATRERRRCLASQAGSCPALCLTDPDTPTCAGAVRQAGQERELQE